MPVEAVHPRSSRVTPLRASLRVIPGGSAFPARPAPSQPSPIFSSPRPDPGFFSALALAVPPCLLFWAVVAFGVYALIH